MSEHPTPHKTPLLHTQRPTNEEYVAILARCWKIKRPTERYAQPDTNHKEHVTYSDAVRREHRRRNDVYLDTVRGNRI